MIKKVNSDKLRISLNLKEERVRSFVAFNSLIVIKNKVIFHSYSSKAKMY